MLPVDPRDERVIRAARHHAALQYIELHESKYLDQEQLIIACAAYLMAEQRVDDTFKAHELAMAALASYQARSQPAWVDISTSTSHVVRVVNPVTQQVHCFTAAELVQIGEREAQERAGAPFQDERRRRHRKTH
ncbi:hypothetical protein ACQKIE_18620 [Luteibacter sp. NPDC031894]|uniref:hypothetical protein n=1 Tax=Luteibacter sp. NPDC031894 TaxID=3390572 RepID=UPI003D061951